MESQTPSDWFRDAFLPEFEIAERQLIALAHAIPAEKFSWRPPGARSISEVFVHVAGGNFFLLELMGKKAPVETYGEIFVEGEERMRLVVRRNDELEKVFVGKDPVIDFLTRSLQAVRHSMIESNGASPDRPEARRVYLRMLAHLHEHMGQMIAYARMIGLPAPWPDWRPDRRGS